MVICPVCFSAEDVAWRVTANIGATTLTTTVGSTVGPRLPQQNPSPWDVTRR